MNINFYKKAFPLAWAEYERWLSRREYEEANHNYWLEKFCGDSDIGYWMNKLEIKPLKEAYPPLIVAETPILSMPVSFCLLEEAEEKSTAFTINPFSEAVFCTRENKEEAEYCKGRAELIFKISCFFSSFKRFRSFS